jgi:hypothetical protein
MGKSLSLQAKLDRLFREDSQVVEFDSLLQNSLSPGRFDNPAELSHHLSEGALLNVSIIGSRALSIPSGEYMVWATDAGHTMLVPIEGRQPNKEVFEAAHSNYEITTPDLLRHWNKVERVLAEAEDDQSQSEEDGQKESDTSESDSDGYADTNNEPQTSAAPEFKSRVDPADIDRNPLLRALEQQGHTVTSLAAAVGVDPPAISRLLRTPKDRQGDPGGRNPSIGTASAIANELRMDVEALFPDIFGVPDQKLKPRTPPGNRGSGVSGAAAGSARKGAATKKWTQGDK